MYGIDISKHNGDINLEPYKGQFVIIRAGYGNFTKDEKFDRNVSECKRLGIPFGVYLYSYALNVDGAKAEAEALLNVLEPIRNDIKVGVWFDMEDADGYKKRHGFSFSHENISSICYEFAKTIEDAGYYSGIYTSASWIQYIKPECDRFDKWVASWGTNDGTLQNDTSSDGTLHQYTSKPLDKNIMYADISRYNGGKAIKPAPAPTPAPSPQKANRLAVDGILGTESVKAMQRWLGTPVDGVVSGQLGSCMKYLLACPNGVWQYSRGGSMMVRALQNWLGVSADGYMGRNTIMALQGRLGVAVDGYLGKNTARALQTYLNNL